MQAALLPGERRLKGTSSLMTITQQKYNKFIYHQIYFCFFIFTHNSPIMKNITLFLAIFLTAFTACRNGGSNNIASNHERASINLKLLNLNGPVKTMKRITYYKVAQKFGDWVVADSSKHVEQIYFFDKNGLISEDVRTTIDSSGKPVEYRNFYTNGILDSSYDSMNPEKSFHCKVLEDTGNVFSFKIVDKSGIAELFQSNALNPDYSLQADSTVLYDTTGNELLCTVNQYNQHRDQKTDDTIITVNYTHGNAVRIVSSIKKLNTDRYHNITELQSVQGGKATEIIYTSYTYYN